MRTSGFLLSFLLITKIGFSQSLLTLEHCYEQARSNYPLIAQKELIDRSTAFNVANVQSGLLPQFAVYGQATYQSDVTQVPTRVPGFEVEPLSKDQYRIYAEVNQTIYEGGSNADQRQILETAARIEDQKIEVELYKIRERINQIFFGILLIDDQLTQVGLLQKDLENNISRTEAGIKNGTAFRMSLDQFQAEYLKAEQRKIEMQSMRIAYLTMLGHFINESLAPSTSLLRPAEISLEPEAELHRPELTLYSFQSDLLGAQHAMGKNKVAPRVGFFLQGGYGRPGLNMLKNEFAGYYQGGIRLSWALSGFYNTRRDKEVLDLNLQQLEVQRKTFTFNTNLMTSQQEQELDKLRKLIEVDEKIIALRAQIRSTAEVQQQNGVITTNDYLRELNAEDQAKQSKLLHQTQLLLTQYAFKYTTGN